MEEKYPAPGVEGKPESEIQSDLERNKEKQLENQASGMQETQRLLQGEQMEEKYPGPGEEGKPDTEVQSNLERKKEKKPENQATGMQETQRLLQGEQMEEKYPAPGEEGTPERIIFTLHSAKDLANMDYMGKSDPYAILTYGSQERRTTTINNNLNPIWNHQVTFDYEENAPTIDIEVFDEDTMARDDSLGRLSIDVAEIKHNKTVTDTMARDDSLGRLSIDVA